MTLDHNQPEYVDAKEALREVEHAIRAANDYDSPEDREQRLAEIRAGHTLLNSARVRAEALIAVVYRALKYLDTSINATILRG